MRTPIEILLEARMLHPSHEKRVILITEEDASDVSEFITKLTSRSVYHGENSDGWVLVFGDKMQSVRWADVAQILSTALDKHN